MSLHGANAFVTDINARTSDQLFDFLLRLSAKGATEISFVILWTIRHQTFSLRASLAFLLVAIHHLVDQAVLKCLMAVM